MTNNASTGSAGHRAGLFDGTAPYYARHRPPYPSEAISTLTDRFGLGTGTEVLDLGCGSGQVALPLAAEGCPVWAVDPDPEMLAEGIRAQHRLESHGTVRWVLAGSADLSRLGLPSLRLCTMGASFHWMDRAAVLSELDRLLDPEGGVALLSGAASVWSQKASVQGVWVDVTREVIQEFLGPARKAGSGTYEHPRKGHQELLRESAFRDIEEIRYSARRVLSVDDIIGLQLSTSYASPAQLGDRLPEFTAELTRRLLEAEPSGQFKTVENTDVILARRPPRPKGGR
nr:MULTISPECIES: class I SAM-dependent methyltransferase [Streptomyces]